MQDLFGASPNALATDYMEKSFADFPRSYPDLQDPNDFDAIAYSPTGFIWDDALAHGKTFRDYGEGTVAVEKNEVEAAKWYEQAAQAGDPIAQYEMGQRYMLGVGVETNRIQACKWLMLASAQGQKDSTALLQKLKTQMSSDEWSQANHLAQESPSDSNRRR